MTPNRVRERRDRAGLSQVALAGSAELSRQALSAIEAGRAVPGVDAALRIARALDTTVEELFGTPGEVERVSTEGAGSTGAGGRVALVEIAGRWVSHALDSELTSADGLVAGARRDRVEVEPVRALAEARQNFLLMGCAAALGLLSDRLNTTGGAGRFFWLPCSSTAALEALGRGRTHVAGVHLVDARTGVANVPDVRRHVGSEPLVLCELARWEVGLVTARGNPKKLRGAADLARRGLRIVTRETGSGARRLFDRLLRDAGVFTSKGRCLLRASGHWEVARAVALGAADTGVATRDAAIAFDLGFVPLVEERYDLAFSRHGLEDARIVRLLEALHGSAVRRELDALGYDVRASGSRVAEVGAA